MVGKGLLLAGVAAAAIFAATPQGKKFIGDMVHRAQDMWASPEVQNTVSTVQGQVRNVPLVGESIADGIQKTKPVVGGLA